MHNQLPSRPNGKHLRQQAKTLLKNIQAQDPAALARFVEHHHRSQAASVIVPSLSDVQLVIAREYGFASWPRLKRHVEQVTAVENRIAQLRAAFAAADDPARAELLRVVHNAARFPHHRPGVRALSEDDARLVIANAEGYAFWDKFQSYLNLDPSVQDVIQAVRQGHLRKLQSLLSADPAASSPHWINGRQPHPMPNDSIPLFCGSEAVFNGVNRHGNEYEIVRALLQAGAAVDSEGGLPLTGAVSYGVIGAVRALLEGGAAVDGPNGRGAPLAYALHFGFTGIAALLADHGAQLDLRFASGLGRLAEMARYFAGGRLIDPEFAGRIGDPYEDRFRCPRTPQNVLDQSLFFASLNGQIEAAGFLLENGADLNALIPGLDVSVTGLHWLTTSTEGKTLAPDAIEEQRLPMLDYLLSRGARTDIRDPQHNATALGWAEYMGRKRMADRLRQRAPA